MTDIGLCESKTWTLLKKKFKKIQEDDLLAKKKNVTTSSVDARSFTFLAASLSSH